MQSLFNTSKHQASVAQALLYVPFFFCCTFFLTQQSFAQTKISCDPTFKQVMFVVDVSGSMETNDRLAEVKQFALRTVKERSKENLLFKLISFGGSCNDVQTDVDWTRDAAVINAGIKGLYIRGGTPLGSALEYTIDNVKKSAYPDQTQIFLLNDGANACGDIKTILQNRVQEIPCAKIYVVGIELQDDENNLTDRALSDAEAISAATGGRFLPLTDVRELQGVSSADTALTVRSVAFEPRKKVAKEKYSKEKIAQEKTQQEKTPQDTATIAVESPRRAVSSPSGESPQQAPVATTSSTTSRVESPTQETSQKTSQQISQKAPQKQPEQPTESALEANSSKRNDAPNEDVPKSNSSPKASPNQASADAAPKESQKKSSPPTNVTKPTKQENSTLKRPRTPAGRSGKPPDGVGTPQHSQEINTKNGAKDVTKDVTKDGTNAETATILSSEPSIEEGIIVFYLPNSTALLPEMKQGLERLVERLRGKSIKNIVVEGHSSLEGSSAINLRLSVQRASSVAALLRKDLNLNDAQVRWNAFGEVRPVAPNETESGRQENRRVEVRVVR